MARARLSREEKKALTRERLLEAAAAVFAQRGLAAASLDEIAEEAGLTKGAVYSNFDSKEDLVVAVLERGSARRMDQIYGEVEFGGTIDEQAHKAGALYMAMEQQDPSLLALWFESMAYAARDPGFRARYGAQHRQAIDGISELIARSAEQRGLPLPLAANQLAVVLNALGMGLAVEKFADPDRVPDDLFGTVISLLYSVSRAEASM